MWELVCNVPVYCEVFKAKDVQESDGASERFGLRWRRLINGCIDLFHDPHKQATVNTLRAHTDKVTVQHIKGPQWGIWSRYYVRVDHCLSLIPLLGGNAKMCWKRQWRKPLFCKPAGRNETWQDVRYLKCLNGSENVLKERKYNEKVHTRVCVGQSQLILFYHLCYVGLLTPLVH